MSDTTPHSPSRCFFAHDKGANPAARSNHSSDKRSLFTITVGAWPAGVVLLCIYIVTLLASCTEKSQEYSRESLLHRYHNFTDSVSSLPAIPFDQIPSVYSRWKDIESNLFQVIGRDTLDKEQNMIALSIMSQYGDKVMDRIFKSIDSRQHDYSDLISLQKAIACRYARIDRMLYSEAEHFYDSISTNEPSPADDIEGSELAYLSFLETSCSCKFNVWSEVEELLRTEDRCYAGYLQNLQAHSQKVTSTIIETTEELTSRILKTAREGAYSPERLVAYMTVRTNRRQMLCARQGLSHIESGNVSHMDDASMSISGIITPFLHFNPVLIASRNQGQIEELGEIGRRIPKAFDKLESQGFILISHPDSLPNRIAKDYITYMLNN